MARVNGRKPPTKTARLEVATPDVSCFVADCGRTVVYERRIHFGRPKKTSVYGTCGVHQERFIMVMDAALAEVGGKLVVE